MSNCLDCPAHPWGEWTEDEARVIRDWGRAKAGEALQHIVEELRISRQSERDAWRDRYEMIEALEHFRAREAAAGIPDGWAVLTKFGEAVEFKGRVREFFGHLLDDDGRKPDAQALAHRDDQFPREAPHRCVPVFFGRRPEQPTGHTCHMCSNSPTEGWGLYCMECITNHMAPVAQGGTA